MKKHLVLVFILLIGSLGFADIFTIGTGTTSQNNVPYNGSYDYGWSKMIYSATELSAAGLGAGMISGIGFQVGNTPNEAPVFNQQVFIRNTPTEFYLNTNTSLPDVAAFQSVYSASYVWQGASWNHIMFDSPFLWDGTSNIEILWENWDGFGVTSYPTFANTPTSTPKTVYNSDNGLFPLSELGTVYLNRPNLRIITTATTLPEPAVLDAPANGAYALSHTILRWNAGAGNPTSYNVYFGTSSNPALVGNQYANNYPLDNLTPGTTYYWCIVPQNNFGMAPLCPVWSFTVPASNQLVQSFETSVPPPGWSNHEADSWVRSTLHQTDGAASAHINGDTYMQYTLSTPRLNIVAGNTLSFDFFSRFPNALMEVVYSPERFNWIVLQTVHNTEGNTWERNTVDLSSIPGQYYLGFRTLLASDDIYIDAVIGPELVSELPVAPVPVSPANYAENVSIYPIFTWAHPSTGGIPTNYNIYLGEDLTPTTLIGSCTNNIYMMNSPLAYNSSYTWTVTSENEVGESDVVTVFHFTTMNDLTINTFPWLVDFGSGPSGWPAPGWTQLKGIFPTPTSTIAQWSRDDWVNAPDYNNAARINVFGTDRSGWLITPPINITSSDFEIQFNLGLTDYTLPNPIEDPTAQQDDKFLVAMSDSRNMANPVILREWNNAGSPYVYNEIPCTGLVSSIPLMGITGIKYFAFYAESTLPGGDNDLYVDNVTVRHIPAGGHIAISPIEWDFGQVLINGSAEKTFNISNNGYNTLCVNSITMSGEYFSLGETFVPQSLEVGESFSITVIYSPTAAGNHTGSITLVDNFVTTVVNLSATCHDPIVATFPWSEDFGTESSDWPVEDWAQYYGPFPTPVTEYEAWEQDDWLNQIVTVDKAARILVNTSNYSSWFISPGFNIPTPGYRLRFDLGLTMQNSSDPISSPQISGDERFIVAVGTSPTMQNLTVLREWNNTGSQFRFNDINHYGEIVSLNLNGISGLVYFAFYLYCQPEGGNFDDLMIDDIYVFYPSDVHDNHTPTVSTTAINGNYPNPFHTQTSIVYCLKDAGPVTMEIYNLKGQLVKRIVQEHKAAGEYTAVWDGKDESGRRVGCGIYISKLNTYGVQSLKKMLLVE